MHNTLRELSADALEHRPADPPDMLLVRLDAPLAPPPEAMISGRLLPSSVLEITPGLMTQIIARCWGFAGAALCQVGKIDDDGRSTDFQAACKLLGLAVAQIDILGTGDEREIAWSV
jgi:hypothetical protein